MRCVKKKDSNFYQLEHLSGQPELLDLQKKIHIIHEITFHKRAQITPFLNNFNQKGSAQTLF